MRLIRIETAPAAIESMLADLRWRAYLELPAGRQGRAYYRAVAGTALAERTFALEHQGEVVALIECDVADGVLWRFGYPIEPRVDPALPLPLRQQVAVDVAAELQRISASSGAGSIRVRSAATNDPDGLLLGILAQAGARAGLELRAVVDLRQTEEALFADLRTAYRQNVRWSRKNMRTVVVDAGAPDRAACQAYQALHATVSGRVTRRPESWEAMFLAIEAGKGGLVLGYWDGQLVSGTLVLDGVDTAYYASGAYRRDLFEKPLSHGTVFEAIKHARKRGRTAFDVGELPSGESGASAKELDIGHFKRGFCSRTQASVILTWRPGVK